MSYYNEYGEQPDIADANEMGVDASGAYWNMGNIRNSRLYQLNLSGSRLLRMWVKDSTLDQCWLNNSTINTCIASNVDWSGSNFTGAMFGTSMFINCKFANAQFRDAQFNGVSFIGCDFTGATLDGAGQGLDGALFASVYKRFLRVDIPEFVGFSSGRFSRLKAFSSLSGSTIIRTDSRGRWLKLHDSEGSTRFNHYRFLEGTAPNFFGRYALVFEEYGRLKSLVDDPQLVHRSIFVGASLQSAKLQGARLLNADLSQADLRGANLNDADLRNAVFDGANLERASLKRAKLEGVDLTKAKTDGMTT
jgi:uncharacterized protein YjbI with pentapeptide repeats